MEDVDFIKWLCRKAESVSIDSDTELYLFGNPVCICDFQSNPLFKKVLLQEAIEGVNREEKYKIDMFFDYIGIVGIRPFFYIYSDIDAAKRSALEYVFTKEKNK